MNNKFWKLMAVVWVALAILTALDGTDYTLALTQFAAAILSYIVSLQTHMLDFYRKGRN